LQKQEVPFAVPYSTRCPRDRSVVIVTIENHAPVTRTVTLKSGLRVGSGDGACNDSLAALGFGVGAERGALKPLYLSPGSTSAEDSVVVLAPGGWAAFRNTEPALGLRGQLYGSFSFEGSADDIAVRAGVDVQMLAQPGDKSEQFEVVSGVPLLSEPQVRP
jgi:hypothetical protein